MTHKSALIIYSSQTGHILALGTLGNFRNQRPALLILVRKMGTQGVTAEDPQIRGQLPLQLGLPVVSGRAGRLRSQTVVLRS